VSSDFFNLKLSSRLHLQPVPRRLLGATFEVEEFDLAPAACSSRASAETRTGGVFN
jgi:hypothetical protein